MMKIPLYTEPLPLQPGPQPKTDFQAALQAAVLDLPYDLTRAPSLLKEWVGREDLLALIDQDWLNPLCRIVGLIGFAGEGKTTLARHWVDRLLDASSLPAPNGVFWWGFYENNSVDEFFEAALLYLSGGQLSFENLSSSLAKANFLAGMLRAGRYLFILDGIETLQHQNGDEYGLIRSNDLFEFLNYFSATQHESFCLITSRAPLYDLIHYITYTQRDVNRLSERDGRELLRKIGVQGTDEEIDQAVTQWDGHALTLSLLGLHVVKRYRGFINCLPGNLIPLSGEPKDERIGRLLRRYDEHLTETERCFLLLFSAFRKPVTLNDLSSILKQNKSKKGLTRSLALLKRSRFIALVKRLAEYRLLRKNEVVNEYTIHPLIRAHYLSCLQAEAQDTIQKFYLSIANYYAKKINLQIKTLADSAPHIEAIYYFCQAEEYNQGFYFWMSTLRFEGISVLSHNFGALETELDLIRDFFPKGNITCEPKLNHKVDKRLIFGTIGFCLLGTGQLRESVKFLERSNKIERELEDWGNASITYYNLSELYGQLGELDASEDAATKALAAALSVNKASAQIFALARLGWVSHLKGYLDRSSSFFERAQILERRVSNVQFLYGQRGIKFADHLRCIGSVEQARRVIEFNLEIARSYPSPNDISCSYRVLGDLEAAIENHPNAKHFYNEALKIARSISIRATLIEVLQARGNWAAGQGEAEVAQGDLDEALSYAISSNYRIYEIDIRVALSKLYLKLNKSSSAQVEMKKVKQMSDEIGYYWGQVASKNYQNF